MLRAALALTLLLGSTPALAEEPQEKPAPAAEKKFELEQYTLVLLKKGPKWTPKRTAALAELMKGHMAHLRKMGESGKMVVAGPFGDGGSDPSLAGLCLYVVPLDEAKKLASEDPAVKAGRFKVEAIPWFAEKGALTFPLAAPGAKPMPVQSN